MSRQDFKLVAPPGSRIWNWIADTQNLGPAANARPAWIRFRTTALSATATSVTDPTNPRVNPDWDFVWTHTAAFLAGLTTDTAAHLAQLAYFQLQGNNGYTVFDRPQPFSFYGTAVQGNAGAGAAPLWMPNGFTLVENPVPYVFMAGESINCTFSCEATFPGVAHTAEVCLMGAYVAKGLQVEQPRQSLQLVLRLGKSLRRFIEVATPVAKKAA